MSVPSVVYFLIGRRAWHAVIEGAVLGFSLVVKWTGMSALSLGAAGEGHQVRFGPACWSVPCPPPGEARLEIPERIAVVQT